MGLPVYVTNFDELAERISVGDISINFDASNIENILSTSFPELFRLLSALVPESGVSKVKGFSSRGEPVSFSPETDILLSGFCFSQSIFDDSPLDSWHLEVVSPSASRILLLDSVFAKDSLQHIAFQRYFPVPAGYEIIISPGASGSKTFWFDLEFLELI